MDRKREMSGERVEGMGWTYSGRAQGRYAGGLVDGGGVWRPYAWA